MGNSTLPRFFAVIALSFSCLSLSVLPMSKGWTQDVSNAEINSYIKKLGSDNYSEYEKTSKALQKLGSKAVPDLVKALQNKNPKVRSSAADALGKIGEKAASATPALAEALKNDNEAYVRSSAAQALGRIGKEAASATPALAEALKNDNDYVRSSVAYALESIGKEAASATPALAEALKNDNDYVRKSAAQALGKIGEKAASATPALAEALKKDKEAEVRKSAADALGKIGEKAASATPALTEALKNDKQAGVRSSAASALGSISEKAASAVPALIEALKNDKQAGVRQYAAVALGRIGEKAASAVPALIEALKKDRNTKVRSNAADALSSIGKEAASAVPALIEALQKDKEWLVHSSAAGALGSIGKEAASGVPALIQALNENEYSCYEDSEDNSRECGSGLVSHNAIYALKNIAESYQDNASKLSSTDLDKGISNLEKALKAADDLKDNFRDEQKRPLHRSLYLLKKEKDSRFFDRTLKWMVKHPWVTGALIYIIFVPSLWFALLRLRPLWLLHIDNALKPFSSFKLPDILGGGTLPIRTLLFIEFFNYRPRVLDAWVVAHIDSAKEGFGKKKTVSDRFVHVPIPIILDNNNLAHLTGKDLQPTFDKKRASLLLWGEGGAGKTSLACQLAVWAMSDDANQRISQHKMLPVLIEQELDFDVAAGEQPLTEAICGQLQALIGEAEPIPEELLAHLLRQRRILVIVDHLSEMSEATRKQIRPGDPDFTANALIVTSRLEEKLDEIPKTTIKPLRVAGDRLSSFMEAYLTQRGKRNLFDDPEYFDACRRLSLMVGQRNITVLLAKLYAEQMIATKEGTAIDLPNNIPDLMLAYLNELNRGAAENEPDNRTVQRDAKAIAWECLKQTLRPTTAILNDVLAALDAHDNAEARLEHLKKRLHLIDIIGSEENKIRFALDPLAEYLAGLYLLDSYGNDKISWHNFLAQAEATSDIELIKGFLLALQDCYLAKGAEAQIPDFVAAKLATLTGLVPQPTRQTQLVAKAVSC
ncbi:PBS lyase [Hassallia byssoidea VB512170]|uniref:PBS lyase n=1 Tax=Hassallia byssoidea VB512170 TaxID=1304833 RepID=A0A846H5X3_9CYAN|nr:HEAT repeat domain-containing protein [Hassalia byssoidea]NEU72665.1 PBS lyase [Hassalia byssoidea VB512170]